MSPLPRVCVDQIRELLKEHGAKHAIEWLGISLDEVHRRKPSQVRYSTHIWPLIERRMSRTDGSSRSFVFRVSWVFFGWHRFRQGAVSAQHFRRSRARLWGRVAPIPKS